MILDYLEWVYCNPKGPSKSETGGSESKVRRRGQSGMNAQDQEHRMRSSSKLEKGKETRCFLELPERTQPFRSLLALLTAES